MLDGAVQGVEDGWFSARIADAAYDLEQRLNDGRYLVVGVNCHTEGNDEEPPETLYIDSSVEELQRKRLDGVRAGRDAAAVQSVLARLSADAADPEVNLMPTLVEASHARATLGEMVQAMGSVFGWWDEAPVI